jgi:hypothetical protein
VGLHCLGFEFQLLHLLGVSYQNHTPPLWILLVPSEKWIQW